MADLGSDEREIVRQGRLFRDLLESPGWKEYEKLIGSHIESRQRQLSAPILVQDEKYQMMDAGTKLAIHESLKGAIIALRLALAIPFATVEQAKEISRAGGAENEGESP